MSKRKLTRRQAWRIEKIQAERAARAQRRDERAVDALNESELGQEQSGVVVAHFGTQVAVEHAPGQSQRCHMRANLEGLVTGDRVVWREGNPTGVVVAREERSNALLRPDPYGSMKAVAANIDQLLIVVAVAPTPEAQLIDRYLVAAENTDIEPVILLNKTDLIASEEYAAAIDSLLAPYEALGYRVLRASSKSEQGMQILNTALSGQTSVFVGQSGVGKSSLVNTLLPEVDLKVGALSEATGKGTHTTTTARLFHMPCGGVLIDSPGIREFGLWHMEPQQIEAGFVELRELQGHCRFRDCKHQSEPGCAVREALDDGRISAQRMASFRHLLSTAETGPG